MPLSHMENGGKLQAFLSLALYGGCQLHISGERAPSTHWI